MKLYFHPLSGCSRRVLAFAGVNNVELELELVDLSAGAQRRPAYLTLNPNGRVPTLVHGDQVLWESVAILRYLARGHAPNALGETDGERGAVDQWTAWGLAHLAPSLSRLNAETGLKRMFGGEPDPETVRAYTDEATQQLAILSQGLEGPFVAGRAPTIADFTLAASVESCQWLSGLALSNDRLESWLGRMTSLEGWPPDPRSKGA